MNRRSRKPSSQATFSPFQILILVLVGIFTLAVLGLLVYLLLALSGSISTPPAASAGNETHATPSLTFTPSAPLSAATQSPLLEPTATQIVPASANICIPQNAEARLGIVSAVIDGDTIEVETDGQKWLVGYAGIDAPSPSDQASSTGVQAAEQNANLVSGHMVTLVKDPSGQDEAGRLLRYVFSGDVFVNYELVRQGYAEAAASTGPMCAAVFQQAEAEARAEQRAMWSPTPVPTRTFIPTVVINNSQEAPCSCTPRPVCADFDNRADAQACFNACNDYNSLLDEDHDGLACEGLP